jgi:hypothetical protein
MRQVLSILACAGVLGLCPAAALSVDAPPLPPIPIPPLPTVPLPPVPAPLPAPPPPVPVPPVPAVPTAPPSPPPAPPQPAEPAPAASRPAAPAPRPVAAAPAAAPSRPAAKHPAARAARHRPRVATLTFRLARPRSLEFTVMQVAPRCRAAGTVRFRAHAGFNRFRFDGRVAGKRLASGTYLLSAEGKRFGVIVERNGPRRIRVAPEACRPQAFASVSASATSVVPPRQSQPARSAEAATPHVEPVGPPAHHFGVLGVHVDRFSPTGGGVSPLFFAGLAVAITLLGLALLPQAAVPAPALAATLTQRRPELALAGLVALLGVVIAYLLSGA